MVFNSLNFLKFLVQLEIDQAQRRKRDQVQIPYAMAICVPYFHDDLPIALLENKNYYINGGWLTDHDVYYFMQLLKAKFPNVNGLEQSNFFTSKFAYVENPTQSFIRILHCNLHWVTVAGNNLDDNINIYDSMNRVSISDDLGMQIDKMMVLPILQQPTIVIRVQKTQKQQLSWCGYFACAFATALCFEINVETILFDTDQLIPHWLGCIENREVSMFPYRNKKQGNGPISINQNIVYQRT
jgi:hypothetical protein